MPQWSDFSHWKAFLPLLEKDWDAVSIGERLTCASRFLDADGRPLLVFSLSAEYERLQIFPRRIYTDLWARMPKVATGPDMKDIRTAQALLAAENICDFLIYARLIRLTSPEKLPLYFTAEGVSDAPTDILWTEEGFICSGDC